MSEIKGGSKRNVDGGRVVKRGWLSMEGKFGSGYSHTSVGEREREYRATVNQGEFCIKGK